MVRDLHPSTEPVLTLAVWAATPDAMEATARAHLPRVRRQGFSVSYVVRANRTEPAKVLFGGYLSGGSELQQLLRSAGDATKASARHFVPGGSRTVLTAGYPFGYLRGDSRLVVINPRPTPAHVRIPALTGRHARQLAGRGVRIVGDSVRGQRHRPRNLRTLDPAARVIL